MKEANIDPQEITELAVDVCTFRQKEAAARTQLMKEEQLLILSETESQQCQQIIQFTLSYTAIVHSCSSSANTPFTS